MKAIGVMVMVFCLCCVTFAGDTNFVAQFKTVWQTHNASNILVFVEQNVATNKSPETLFARGIVANMLQLWLPGATNYWEQAAQMISTNTVYTEQARTSAVKGIRGLSVFVAATSPSDLPPSWDTNAHALYFSRIAKDEPFEFDILEIISTLETVEQ